jgi:hypothetical protein
MNIDTIIEFLYVGVMINFWTGFFGPFQPYRTKITEYLLEIIAVRGLWFAYPFVQAINCSKCLGLWIGTIWFWDIRIGALLSVFTYLLSWILKKINEDGNKPHK